MVIRTGEEISQCLLLSLLRAISGFLVVMSVTDFVLRMLFLVEFFGVDCLSNPLKLRSVLQCH